MGAGTVEFPRTHRRAHAQRAAHPADAHAQPRRGGTPQRDHAPWESDAFIDDNTLTVNVNRLRKTLGSFGRAGGLPHYPPRRRVRRMSGHGTGEADTPIAPSRRPPTCATTSSVWRRFCWPCKHRAHSAGPRRELGGHAARRRRPHAHRAGRRFSGLPPQGRFTTNCTTLPGSCAKFACFLPHRRAALSGREDRLRYGLAPRTAFQPRRRQPLRDNEAATAVTWNCGSTRSRRPSPPSIMLANNPGPESAKVAHELERIEAQVDQALYYARSTSVERDYAIREINLASAAREA